MGFLGLFGIGRKKKTVADEEKELDVIKHIEDEAKKLEKQWEEKEKDFALKKIKAESLRVGIGPSISRSIYPGFPNKHIKDIWKRYIRLSKMIHAIEHLMELQKSKEQSIRNKHDIRIINKLNRMVEHQSADAISMLEHDLNEMISAIEEGRSTEKKIIAGFVGQVKFEEITKSEAEEGYEVIVSMMDHLKETNLDPDSVFNGYDFHKRMRFFDHLESECRRLKRRLDCVAEIK